MMTMVISGSDGVTFPDSTNQFSGGAFSFKNRIINGDMRIDQRNAGAAVTTSSSFPVDRFFVFNNTDGAFSAQQDSSAPVGFVNSLKLTVTTADASVGSTQQLLVQHRIEGFNSADLNWGSANAKTITLSFWVRSSVTGTFGGSLRNSAADRSYPFTYSISVADTWEQKSITIAGDTTGTWLTTNGIGVGIVFGLGVGSSFTGTANQWNAANNTCASGVVDLVTTLNATWYITGLQFEVGSVATPFERRPYGTELALCQRYYYKLQASATANSLGVGFNDSTTAALVINTFPVSMRTNPTALEQTGTAGDYSIRYSGANVANCSSVPTFVNATVSTAATNLTVSSGLTAGQGMFARAVNTNAYLAWSAEL
jgi:hypothetical protein